MIYCCIQVSNVMRRNSIRITETKTYRNKNEIEAYKVVY